MKEFVLNVIDFVLEIWVCRCFSQSLSWSVSSSRCDFILNMMDFNAENGGFYAKHDEFKAQ